MGSREQINYETKENLKMRNKNKYKKEGSLEECIISLDENEEQNNLPYRMVYNLNNLTETQRQKITYRNYF
jgi:hypothetical protein